MASESSVDRGLSESEVKEVYREGIQVLSEYISPALARKLGQHFDFDDVLAVIKVKQSWEDAHQGFTQELDPNETLKYTRGDVSPNKRKRPSGTTNSPVTRSMSKKKKKKSTSKRIKVDPNAKTMKSFFGAKKKK